MDAGPSTATAAETATPPPGSLTGAVVGGIGWNLLSQLTVQVTRIGAGIALARLLTPREFGIAGMALVVGGFVTAFTDVSLGAALVQRREISEHDRSTVFWTTLALGVVCTGAGIGLSGLVASFYGEDRVGPLFAVLSVTFALAGLSVTQVALLTRELRYRALQIRTTIGIVAGAIAGVALAAAGTGAWALIAQSVVTGAVTSLLLWTASSWRPRRMYSLASLRDMGGFGLALFGSRLLAYANLNADNLLIGRFLGARPLGIYTLAYNTMFTPMTRIGLPIQQVLAPAYARLQDEPERLATAWLRSKRLSAAILAPAFLGMLVVAPDLVPVVFGERWDRAIGVLQLLCLAGVAHTLVTLNWSALQARGKGGTLLLLNLFVTAVVVGAFAIGLQWGILGVAGSFAVAKWLLVVPDTWITCRGMATRTWSALRAGLSVLPVAIAMAGVVWGARLLLLAADAPQALRLVLVVATGVVAYPALARIATPSLVAEVRDLLRRRRAGASTA